VHLLQVFLVRSQGVCEGRTVTAPSAYLAVNPGAATGAAKYSAGDTNAAANAPAAKYLAYPGIED